MNRRFLGGSIIVAWLLALSWMGYREMNSASASGIDDTLRTVPPGAAYYIVSVDDIVIGYASRTVDTVPEGIVVDDRLILELPGAGELARTDMRTVANLTNNFELQDFETTVGSDRGGFVTTGTVADDTTIGLRLTTQEALYSAELNMSPAVVMQAYLPLRLAFSQGLSAADTLSVPQFDPIQWDHASLGLQVLADSTLIFPDSAVWDSTMGLWVPARWDTLRAWKVRQSSGGQYTDTWIDELGQLVSVTNQSGFNVTRTAFEIAFHNFRTRDTSIGNISIVHQTPVAAGITTLSSETADLQLTVGNADFASETLEDDRQTLSGSTLTIQRNDNESLRSTLRLPAPSDGPYAEFLTSTPTMQSDDPRIQARARLIIDGTRNASRATNRLVTWVHENIEKRADVGVPSALNVLENEGGDSYEHATLFIALARAVGLPARPAAGLMLIDGRFYYHVWAEVDMGSGWVAVDPTFGQVPADASHIRFTNDLPAGDIEMVQLIGDPMLSAVSEEE